MEKKMLVDGMKCAHCKAAVEKALKNTAGVLDAEVNLEEKTVCIRTEGDVSDNVLMDAVREKGFVPVRML